MFSRHRRKVSTLFNLADILLTAIAFEAAYQSRMFFPRELLERPFYLETSTKLLLLGFCIVVWPALARWLSVAEKLEAGNPLVIIRDSFQQCLLGAVGLVLFEYLLRKDLSRPFVLLVFVYSWALTCVFRLTAGKMVGLIGREFGKTQNILVVGVGQAARRLGAELERASRYGVRLVAFVSENGAGEKSSVRLQHEYKVHPLAELPLILRRQVIDEIVFAVESRDMDELADVLLLCDEQGVRTRVLVDFFPHVNSEIYLERLGRMPLLTFSAVPHDEMRLLVKRMTDIVVAGSALALLSPLMALVAVLVRLTSPGPAIFRQVRCGLNGRRFIVLKFRSMVDDAEKLKPSIAHLNQRDTVFKVFDDPRLTPLGRLLRKFSIDEWPQLWNVLRGDMSLVGPRPAVPEEVEKYKGWQRRRLRMRPGLTCLWVLEGRDALDFETWMKMDMQYIDSWSLSLDWKILLRTIPQVLTGKGAH